MLKSISSNLTSIFFHGLLILIFNSFNIEKKFYHEKLLPTSIVGSLQNLFGLHHPKTLVSLELEGEDLLEGNKTFYAFHCMNNYWQG
jgi:hypothetical protein